MTAKEILAELKAFGNESTKKTLMKHGAREPFFGVKVEYLKKIQKKVKKDYFLALELYKTGNSDAMYLAALIADEKAMTKQDLQEWADGAYWYYLSEYAVPWVAAESRYGFELAEEWIDSELHASTGWSTFTSLLSITANDDLDTKMLEKLMKRVEKDIHTAPNRVRHTMNGFIIAVGTFVPALTEKAKLTAGRIGQVFVDMGGTACKVPDAVAYIEKAEGMGRIGKKKKGARC